jgi:hypothetical protein
MPHYTIDRFEGAWAVLENEQAQTFQVPRAWLPADAREGDVLAATEEGQQGTATLHLRLDPAMRNERLTNAGRTRDRLPRGPKGDIAL